MVEDSADEGRAVEGSESVEEIRPGPNTVDITPKSDGGVLKEVLKEGDGDAKPSPGSKVHVHYVGKLTDGTEFDSSRQRTYFSFDLAKGKFTSLSVLLLTVNNL